MDVIYEGLHSDILWWHDIPTKFYEDLFRHSSNIKVITASI
jgi:hypothetical protein